MVREKCPYRIGIGYDLHRLEMGVQKPIVLGGVRFDDPRGVVAHSDGDVLVHAVIDALLGAANLGDIGRLFKDDDARWKDKSGLFFLENVYKKVQDRGYAIGNIDAVIIAEQPKISPHVACMQRHLAACLDLSTDCISVKAKTNEGVDAIGAKQAIAVQAVCLLFSV